MTCSEIFEKMPQKFEEFKLHHVNGVFQFNVTGKGGGDWFAVCDGGSCRVRAGQCPKPDVTVAVSAENAVKLAQHRMNPALALVTRRIKVRGDLGLIGTMKSLLLHRI